MPSHRLTLALTGMLLAACGSTARAQNALFRWHDNMDRAAAAARDSGKPLFVVFRCVR